ncbi:MAG: hypothetical protein Q4D34_07760 [Eggerthellaceae bacterium]|nr:hypothetical protein [Eggerthellaceae bacterium]
MIKKRFAKLIAFACIGALAICMLAGCAQQSKTPEQQQQEANRAYMSQINKIASELQDELDGLSISIKSGDKVTIVSKANDALAVLDKIEKLEVPDALQDVHEHYAAGCASLREALSGYVDLYANAQGTSDASYSARLSQIQDLYNAGIDELKQADQAAAGKE